MIRAAPRSERELDLRLRGPVVGDLLDDVDGFQPVRSVGGGDCGVTTLRSGLRPSGFGVSLRAAGEPVGRIAPDMPQMAFDGIDLDQMSSLGGPGEAEIGGIPGESRRRVVDARLGRLDRQPAAVEHPQGCLGPVRDREVGGERLDPLDLDLVASGRSAPIEHEIGGLARATTRPASVASHGMAACAPPTIAVPANRHAKAPARSTDLRNAARSEW